MLLRELIRDGLAMYVAHPNFCTSHAIMWTGLRLTWFGRTPKRKDTERRMICQTAHLIGREWVAANGLELCSGLKHELAMRGEEKFDQDSELKQSGYLGEIVRPGEMQFVSHPCYAGLYKWNGQTLLSDGNRMCSVLPHMILDDTWTTP